jgi:hypothetical protein
MLNLKITKESISEILLGLRSGKAMGYDEIPNEFLRYGRKDMLSSLVDLFAAISDFEQIPPDWQNGIIKPIHKSGSLFELDNYRGITLSSNVYKVFSKVIEKKIVSFLEDSNILGESQGAFRKNRRLEDHIFTLQKKKEKNTYLAFLDLSKAFDRVWREGLFFSFLFFYLLWQNGIQGKSWRLLWSLYKEVNNRVLYGNYESD